MKKGSSKSEASEKAEMLPEYDFRNGVRGKHHKAYREGHAERVRDADGTTTVRYFQLEDGAVMLDPDVREYFRDSESVNSTLRSLISLVPQGRPSSRT